MRTTVKLAGVGVIMALALAGCSPYEETNTNGLMEKTITLEDGREITCVAWQGPSSNGGLSCDWG